MDTFKELAEIVCDYKGEEVALTPETTFDDLGFDSLDKADLVMQVEEKFDITIDMTSDPATGEALVINTMADLVSTVESLKA